MRILTKGRIEMEITLKSCINTYRSILLENSNVQEAYEEVLQELLKNAVERGTSRATIDLGKELSDLEYAQVLDLLRLDGFIVNDTLQRTISIDLIESYLRR